MLCFNIVQIHIKYRFDKVFGYLWIFSYAVKSPLSFHLKILFVFFLWIFTEVNHLKYNEKMIWDICDAHITSCVKNKTEKNTFSICFKAFFFIPYKLFSARCFSDLFIFISLFVSNFDEFHNFTYNDVNTILLCSSWLHFFFFLFKSVVDVRRVCMSGIGNWEILWVYSSRHIMLLKVLSRNHV